LQMGGGGGTGQQKVEREESQIPKVARETRRQVGMGSRSVGSRTGGEKQVGEPTDMKGGKERKVEDGLQQSAEWEKKGKPLREGSLGGRHYGGNTKKGAKKTKRQITKGIRPRRHAESPTENRVKGTHNKGETQAGGPDQSSR